MFECNLQDLCPGADFFLLCFSLICISWGFLQPRRVWLSRLCKYFAFFFFSLIVKGNLRGVIPLRPSVHIMLYLWHSLLFIDVFIVNIVKVVFIPTPPVEQNKVLGTIHPIQAGHTQKADGQKPNVDVQSRLEDWRMWRALPVYISSELNSFVNISWLEHRLFTRLI